MTGVSKEFISGRQEAIQEMLEILKFDHDRHAPHGVWNLAGPLDQPIELDALAKDYGGEVITLVRDALDGMMQGYSVHQLTHKMYIEGYEATTGNTAHDGRMSALEDMRYMLAMMNLQGLGARVFARHLKAIKEDNHEASFVALNHYAAGMMSNFIQDIGNLENRYLREKYEAEKGKLPRRKRFTLRRMFNALGLTGTKPDERVREVYDRFKTMPKLWPPLHRSPVEPPEYAHGKQAGPQSPVIAPDGGNYGDGLHDGLRAIYSGLQSFHFASLNQDGYLPILPQDKAQINRGHSMARDLFSVARDRVAELVAAPVIAEEGDYADGLRQAAINARLVLTSVMDSPEFPKDDELEDFAEKLVKHWIAHADNVIGEALKKMPADTTDKSRKKGHPRPAP